MTAFDKWAELDPAKLQRDIETSECSDVTLTRYIDVEDMVRRINAKHPGTVNVWGNLDPHRLLQQLSVGCAGGGNDYVAKAVHFDGSTYLTLASYAGADSPYLSFVMWINMANIDFNYIPFAFTDPNINVYPNISTTTQLVGGAYNDDEGDNTLDIDSIAPSPQVAANIWTCFMGNVDLNHPQGEKIGQLVVQDVVQTIDPARTFDNGTGGNLLLNGLGITVPRFLNNTDQVFDLADLQVWAGTFIDFSIVENRRLFLDAGGKPVDPASAAAQFGAQTILFSGNASSFPVNQGTGGTFALTAGTLTDASTSPSD